MSKRRSPVAYVALFVVPFLLAMGASYVVRSRQLDANADSTAVQVETAPTETTAPAETTVAETSAPPVETTTEVPVETTTTAAPTTTTEAPTIEAPPAPVGTGGARFGSTSEQRTIDANIGCGSLVRPDSNFRDCQQFSSNGTTVIWVSMDEGVDVLTPAADAVDVWNVVLRAEGAPSRQPLVTDATGDGENDLVVGWRNDNVVDVDVVQVVDGVPTVALALSNLRDGRVQAGDGSINVWSAVDGTESYVYWGYTGGAGAWQPSSQLTSEPSADSSF